MVPSRENNTPSAADHSLLLTALHIGASSVSMIIAEHNEDGTLTPIDFLEQPAPLAQDVFSGNIVSNATTERIVSIIRGYQQTLSELEIDPHNFTRAVATNVLHEANNYETVLNRIRIACGLPVEMIDDGEMTRLIYLKTQRRIQHLPTMNKRTALVLHVGPGNTRALLFQDGKITRYTSYRMGTHRTREAVEASLAEGASLLRVIREHASGNLSQLRYDYSDVTIEGLVLIGYEIQAVSRFLSKDGKVCPLKTLRTFTKETATLSDLEAVKHFQLDYQTAQALLSALEINLAIAEILSMEQVYIPTSEYEQGLLHDLLASRNLTDTFTAEVLRSAKILANRYQSDAAHGAHVGKLCNELITNLQDLHQLTEHDALLLQVAAILHEVGTFVSPRAHHKHSEYIILNSEIFGLDRLDVTIVALVSRYHRQSVPRLDHPSYAALKTEDRIRVCKLAALLRVADALERTHDQRVKKLEFTRTSHQLNIRLPGIEDAAIERLAMVSKADLFEQVFGLVITLEEDN